MRCYDFSHRLKNGSEHLNFNIFWALSPYKLVFKGEFYIIFFYLLLLDPTTTSGMSLDTSMGVLPGAWMSAHLYFTWNMLLIDWITFGSVYEP